MGKGGANPYPGWWASSDKPVQRDKPTDWSSPDMKHYRHYHDEEERKRKEKDAYYNEKSYSQRRKEFNEEFKRKFMEGEFFKEPEVNQSEIFKEDLNEVHPIFKIKKSSSEEDFKKQYIKLILKHHPDKGGEPSIFIQIKEAWDIIKLRFSPI